MIAFHPAGSGSRPGLFTNAIPKKLLQVGEKTAIEEGRDGKSRLIASLFGYAPAAGKTMARSFRDYHPIQVFTGIGLILILLGLAVGFGVLTHYFETGVVTPYLPSAVLTTVLVIVGLQAIVFGLLADMMKTQRMLAEEILYRMKKKV